METTTNLSHTNFVELDDLLMKSAVPHTNHFNPEASRRAFLLAAKILLEEVTGENLDIKDLVDTWKHNGRMQEYKSGILKEVLSSINEGFDILDKKQHHWDSLNSATWAIRQLYLELID